MMATDYNCFLQEAVMGITGLPSDNVRVLQEPVAAAISYPYGEDTRVHYDNNQKVMVFDLGGGILDVTIMGHDSKKMTCEILAKEGDLNLGGNDWDDALAEAVKKKIGIIGFSLKKEEETFHRLVIKLKISLMNFQDSMIFFDYEGGEKHTRFNCTEFEEASKHIMGRAIDLLMKKNTPMGRQ